MFEKFEKFGKLGKLAGVFGCAVAIAMTTHLLTSPAQSSDESDVALEQLRADVDAWHAQRLASLRRSDGWLSLVGLYALPDGEHRLGSAGDQDLSVPAGHPPHIGVLEVDSGIVTMRTASGVDLRHGDDPVTSIVMQSDVTGDPTLLEVGDLLFYVIERDGRSYLRVKDRSAPTLKSFEGIDRWAVSEQWRIEGRWVPYDEPRVVKVPNIMGNVDEVEVRAAVEFEVDGRSFRLDPTSEDGSLFFVFGDATNGVESYGAGRFLYTDLPDEKGRVVLDFNRAYNPPCVFTPFATCPLPPEGNVLDLEVRAGEKMWGELH